MLNIKGRIFSDKRSTHGLSAYITLALITFIGISLSITAYFIVRSWDDVRVQVELEHNVDDRTKIIEEGIAQILHFQNSIRGLFSASYNVEREEFRSFVNYGVERPLGINLLGWIPRVSDIQRGEYETEARSDGLSNFQFTELNANGDFVKAGRREEYYPIFFVEPTRGNETALGYDYSSTPSRMKNLIQARDTGMPTASSRFAHGQGASEHFEFEVIVPIYLHGVAHETIVQRRESLIGYSLAIFDIGEMIESIMKNVTTPIGMDIYFFDDTAEPGKRFLHYHPSRKSEQTRRQLTEKELAAEQHWQRSLDVAGRNWKIVFRPLAATVDARQGSQARMVLILGLTITLMLMAYLLINIRRNRETLRLLSKISESNEVLEIQIADRKQAEARLSGILDIANDAVISIDESHRVILFNKGAEQIFGYGAEEVLGEPIEMLMPSHARENHRGDVKNFAEGAEVARQMGDRREVAGRRKDGTEFPGEASISKLDLDGSQIFTVILRDVTERRQAEEAVAKQSQLLETTFETMNQGITVYDADNRLVAFNQRFVELFDFPPGLVRTGMPFEEFARFNAERGEYGPGDVEELVRERVGASDRGEINRRERTRPDGTVISARRDPMPDGGHVTTYSDISKRKKAEKALRESEAKFRAVVDNSPTKIHIKDAEGRYTLVNPLAEKLFGFTDEEVRGKTSYDIFPKEVADAFTAHDRQVAESREMAEQVEHFMLEDGEHTYLTVKFPILDAQGEVTGIAAIGTDITEQQTAKAEILKAKEQAELANRTKSEFLANMSHELRTPLNAILGFSELMGNATLGPLGNPKYQEYAKDINDSGRHLLALIQDILDLSKIEAGKLELDEEDIDVARTIRSCMVLVKERARNGGVKLKTDIPDGLPVLHADQRKLKQILVNLLSNAVKFTPAGGTVTIKAWCKADAGYVFQVIDTGIGMALADIPKALSPFGQVDSQFDRKYEGTGLGLPLTKSLAEMHGGSLDLQSEEGIGTTVTVRFPSERIVYVSGIEATGTPGA
ncbi:MAG: PAS domain S-box protein [Proteobacteria bacterium]|nr:PAS domain S-box protein [Pseudomonadota bacterium]